MIGKIIFDRKGPKGGKKITATQSLIEKVLREARKL